MFACRIVPLRPEGRGEITLSSADPLAHPRISQHLLSTENDWKKLRNGIGIFRDLARRRQLAPFIAAEIGPGADVTTDPQLEAYTRKTAVTAHHPVGTCRMGAVSHALAYNLGLRTLATPEPIKDWSLTSLKKKLIKIGAKVVSHGRYVVFQMAEVAILMLRRNSSPATRNSPAKP
jgi:GMC oxidoreductase